MLCSKVSAVEPKASHFEFYAPDNDPVVIREQFILVDRKCFEPAPYICPVCGIEILHIQIVSIGKMMQCFWDTVSSGMEI